MEQKTKRDPFPYEDIADLPHHVSETHPPMSRRDRAAQFSPFAALTGHSAAIAETARLTREKIELEEDAREMLNARLQLLQEALRERPEISVTYFVSDKQKPGGAYVTAAGAVKRIDPLRQRLLLADGTEISFDSILTLEGDLFDRLG